MNRTAREIVMRRRREDQRSGSRRMNRDRYDYRDYEDGYDYVRGRSRGRDRMNYRDGHYEEDDEDYRSRDYRNYPDYNDYGTYGNYRMYGDFRDYSDDMRLTKSDIKEWKEMLENADGSKGEHFDKRQIMDAADKIGVRYNGYDENELCLTANIMYSDYCEALKMFVPQDKESIVYTKLAKAFLEDEDAPKGSEKLALYYNCIVREDE